MSVHIESVGHGRPLVLLHGFAMHSGLWTPLLPRLIDRYRVHMVDLPGHGSSPPIEPYTLEALASVVATSISAFVVANSEAPVLLGWSLGGAVALQWALSQCAHLGPIVLAASSPCFVRREGWQHAMARETLQRFADELSVSYRLTLQRFLALQLRGSEHADTTLDELRRHVLERRAPSRTDLHQVVELVAAIDLRSSVARIRQPVLVIAGDRDTFTPLDAAQWLAEALPLATLRVITGAAHAPFLSHPDAFVAELRRFTDEH